MALVKRNGNTYSYKSIRKNGKVTSRYVGAGEWAELWEEIDRHDRAEREESRRHERDAIEQAERDERVIIAYCRAVDARVRVLLEHAGYHQHKRGEWRRTRVRGRASQAAPHQL